MEQGELGFVISGLVKTTRSLEPTQPILGSMDMTLTLATIAALDFTDFTLGTYQAGSDLEPSLFLSLFRWLSAEKRSTAQGRSWSGTWRQDFTDFTLGTKEGLNQGTKEQKPRNH